MQVKLKNEYGMQVMLQNEYHGRQVKQKHDIKVGMSSYYMNIKVCKSSYNMRYEGKYCQPTP